MDDNNKWSSWFYKSAAWVKCRETFVASTDGCCECCKVMGLVTPGVVVHHHIPLTPENIHDPEISLNHSNLHLLCISCHNKIHYSGTVRMSLFDDDGNLYATLDLSKFIDVSYLNNGKKYFSTN